jgi:broad specificity phosphatase PhoE
VIEVVFVRHAQPDWEPDGKAVDEPGLTPLGRQQAERVAQALAEEPVDALCTSTMRRAIETAEPIAARLGLEARAESWICELGLPSLEGSPMQEVAAFFARSRARDLQEWWRESIAGGESFRHFHERVTAGIEALLVDSFGARLHLDGAHRLWHPPEQFQRIVVVAHGGSIAVAVSHLLGLEPVPWAHERMRLGWAGLVRLRTLPIASGAIWSMLAFNSRRHLHGLPDPEG